MQCIISALENGSVHPILCIPSLCALESSHDQRLSLPAFTIHQKLYEKHSSFIHTKSVESVHCVYQYQISLQGPEATGLMMVIIGVIGGVSVIESLYSLTSQSKKKRKAELLKSLVNLLTLPVNPTSSVCII
jgi:hypothetical protein